MEIRMNRYKVDRGRDRYTYDGKVVHNTAGVGGKLLVTKFTVI